MLERGEEEGVGDGDGEWDAPCVVDLTGVELDLDDLAALEGKTCVRQRRVRRKGGAGAEGPRMGDAGEDSRGRMEKRTA